MMVKNVAAMAATGGGSAVAGAAKSMASSARSIESSAQSMAGSATAQAGGGNGTEALHRRQILQLHRRQRLIEEGRPHLQFRMPT